MLLMLYVIMASSCVAMQYNSCCVCFIVSLVGLTDWDAMALIGHISVLSTALPRNKKFPHTC